MTNVAIAQQRLQNHHLSHPQLKRPDAIVAWLGAVQAQEYAGAKWALVQRMPGATDAAIEQAFTDGAILRTHLLRPTWHFVTPADIRWMLALTAPRVHALNAYYYRKCELDKTIFARSHDALVNALQGGKQLMREEVRTVLEQAGIATKGDLRFAYLMMHAELDGIVCSGARRGKQFTYALVEERVPPTRKVDRDEALAELVKRYFTSHGPATVQDFTWWSGLHSLVSYGIILSAGLFHNSPIVVGISLLNLFDPSQPYRNHGGTKLCCVVERYSLRRSCSSSR